MFPELISSTLKYFSPSMLKSVMMYETHGRGQFKIGSKTSLNMT